jgi:alpha-beta hydrolase superfamily lysophospholipase
MTHYAAAGQPLPTIESMPWTKKLWVALTGVTVPRPQNVHTPHDLGLNYEVHIIAATSDEVLETWWVPHTEPRGIVVLFHSYASSKESLLAPTGAFFRLGMDVVLVDFRGSGGSSRTDTTLGVREAKDVALAVADVRKEWPDRRVVLYGVSMGSAAILRAIAVEGVQPDAIILESPYDRLLSATRNRFHAMGFPTFPAAELLVFWGGLQFGYNGFKHNPVEYAASVNCPALLLHGERDPRVTTEQATAVFQQLQGPKQMISFPEGGHELLITTEPNLWNDNVAQFLDQLLDQD